MSQFKQFQISHKYSQHGFFTSGTKANLLIWARSRELWDSSDFLKVTLQGIFAYLSFQINGFQRLSKTELMQYLKERDHTTSLNKKDLIALAQHVHELDIPVTHPSDSLVIFIMQYAFTCRPMHVALCMILRCITCPLYASPLYVGTTVLYCSKIQVWTGD